MNNYTTIATCPAPTDFEVTEVTGHTATMVWNGTSDSYVVNYRIPGHLEFIDANFENGELPAGWISEGAGTWIPVDGKQRGTQFRSGLYRL